MKLQHFTDIRLLTLPFTAGVMQEVHAMIKQYFKGKIFIPHISLTRSS